MSYYARIDDDGIVVQVIAIEKDMLDTGNWGDPNNWIQTSYNTRGGVHYAPNSNEPDGGVALRKNYAGVGYIYDKVKDAFMEPQPFPSWTLDEDSCYWIPPVAHPRDGKGPYNWDEVTLNWVKI
tara:strand:+ start:175 stop:546 length:372 start_codon:yes stop_codon:yes gene_type:complete